jgi:hypothetical protein
MMPGFVTEEVHALPVEGSSSSTRFILAQKAGGTYKQRSFDAEKWPKQHILNNIPKHFQRKGVLFVRKSLESEWNCPSRRIVGQITYQLTSTAERRSS